MVTGEIEASSCFGRSVLDSLPLFQPAFYIEYPSKYEHSWTSCSQSSSVLLNAGRVLREQHRSAAGLKKEKQHVTSLKCVQPTAESRNETQHAGLSPSEDICCITLSSFTASDSNNCRTYPESIAAPCASDCRCVLKDDAEAVIGSGRFHAPTSQSSTSRFHSRHSDLSKQERQRHN